MSDNYFEGYYFKHQKGNKTVAIIPARADNRGSIQIITNEKSYNYIFPEISLGKVIEIGNCRFSKSGIIMDTKSVSGRLAYSGITPISYDIMGPFKYFPMECRHGVISMGHSIMGGLTIEGEYYDFNGGTGYIEKDSGCSFPEEYMWLHSNSFEQECSIMASVATIPFAGIEFLGCICVIFYMGKEYRLATYTGVKIISYSERELVLLQGKFRLVVEVNSNASSPLYAPKNGKMANIVHESNSASARFRFYENNEIVFDMQSSNVSFEYSSLIPNTD